MNTVPYLAPHMGPLLALLCVVAIGVGLALADRSIPETSSPAPDIYTNRHVQVGETYYTEQHGEIQEFQVTAIHPSGFFQIRVSPPDGHELDRDYQCISGWTCAIPSTRHIEAVHLKSELPEELLRSPIYN